MSLSLSLKLKLSHGANAMEGAGLLNPGFKVCFRSRVGSGIAQLCCEWWNIGCFFHKQLARAETAGSCDHWADLD
jgi:hypothetical protein